MIARCYRFERVRARAPRPRPDGTGLRRGVPGDRAQVARHAAAALVVASRSRTSATRSRSRARRGGSPTRSRSSGWRRASRDVEISGPLDGRARVHERASASTTSSLLDPDPAVVERGFRSSVRRNVRTARGSGLSSVVRPTETDMVDTFYRLQVMTRHRLGLPPQPRGFFRGLWREVLSAGLGHLTIVESDGRPVAAGAFLRWNGVTIYKYGASDPAALEPAAEQPALRRGDPRRVPRRLHDVPLRADGRRGRGPAALQGRLGRGGAAAALDVVRGIAARGAGRAARRPAGRPAPIAGVRRARDRERDLPLRGVAPRASAVSFRRGRAGERRAPATCRSWRSGASSTRGRRRGGRRGARAARAKARGRLRSSRAPPPTG